jgi:hypothetical protein
MPVEPRGPDGIKRKQDDERTDCRVTCYYRVVTNLSSEAEAIPRCQSGASPRMLGEERYRESRMREIRLSGSRREDWVAIVPSSPLLYWEKIGSPTKSTKDTKGGSAAVNDPLNSHFLIVLLAQSRQRFAGGPSSWRIPQ